MGRCSNPDNVARLHCLQPPAAIRCAVALRILNDEDIAVARQMYDTGQSLAVIGERHYNDALFHREVGGRIGTRATAY